jgi:hypothetical protein
MAAVVPGVNIGGLRSAGSDGRNLLQRPPLRRDVYSPLRRLPANHIGGLGGLEPPCPRSPAPCERSVVSGVWAAGLLSTWLPLEQIVAAGDQANSIGPLWSPAPLFRRGLCTVAQGRAALCTDAECQVTGGTQGPGAKFHLALVHGTALSGTTRPVSGMSALVQGRPPNALAVLGGLAA